MWREVGERVMTMRSADERGWGGDDCSGHGGEGKGGGSGENVTSSEAGRKGEERRRWDLWRGGGGAGGDARSVHSGECVAGRGAAISTTVGPLDCTEAQKLHSRNSYSDKIVDKA